MTAVANILICDDDRDIVAALKIYLSSEGYTLFEAYNGREALEAVRTHDIHLILMDIMMPELDGISATAALRQECNIPIILLTAKSEGSDKVLGLNIGADDYITKPFGISELMARVRTALRHKATVQDSSSLETTIRVKDLTIDIAKHTVTKGIEEIHFTQNEFKCLALLGKYAGKVLTYDFIMKNIWGPYSPSDNQILRVNMANIRRKLKENPAEPKYILTELGIGYRMLVDN